MTLNPVIIWFLAGLALILSEFMLPGVILVFFGAGAWLTALGAAVGLTPGWTAQLLTFAVSSVLLLVLLRRRLRSRFFGYVSDDRDLSSNLDDLAGELVTVTLEIAPGREGGRVEYKGATWNARADTVLPAGRRAVVVRADGITLVVRPAD